MLGVALISVICRVVWPDGDLALRYREDVTLVLYTGFYLS